jgi:phage shock protein PspC (stress-responsive transcriptional regulator)
MVAGRPSTDDRRMTIDQPTAPRPLRRRGDDRVLGGVASGLADYFNVDPLLVRIGFVGLMVFNGLGLGLYLLAWLFVPTDTDNQSVVQRAFARGGFGGALMAIGLILIAALVLFNVPPTTYLIYGGREVSSGGLEFVLLVLVAIVIGVLLFRRRESQPPTASAVTSAPASAEPRPVEAARAAVPPPVVVRRPARPPSPLGWYVFGAMLIGSGLLALATVVAGTDVDLVRYFGLGLLILGIGLVIGTWFGHARALIVVGLLLLPFGIAASLIHVPFEGGFGSLDVRPTGADDLAAEYRLAGGQISLDLSQIEDDGAPIEVDASVAMGDLLVVLPEDAAAELDAQVGAGTLLVLGDSDDGMNLEQSYAIEGGGPRFVLNLGTGLGIVRVETRNEELGS